jgi:glycine cleavage system H lipoate-binding protein
MSEVRYTDQHEWIRLDGDEATVGITKYAAKAWAMSCSWSFPPAARP